MFSHRREAGGWAEGASLCISVYVDGFMSALSLKAPEEVIMPEVKMETK